MKKFIVIASILLSSSAFAAKQTINNGETMGQARTKINSNFTEVYNDKANVSCFISGAAFDACFDLSWVNPAFNSVNVTSGNIAANNMQVTKPWITGLSYTADVTSVIHGGKHWIAKTTHTAGSGNEPGTEGGNAAWAEVSGAGDNLGSATYSNVVALWALGACSGYLKSDGSCDTPSGSATYPGSAGVANWNGSAWGTSYTVGTGANNLVQLNASSQLPAVSAALLTNFPTLNQNTTGTAAGLTAQYIDWNAASGGSSIANKPNVVVSGSSGYVFNMGALSDLQYGGATLIDDTMSYGSANDNLRLWSVEQIGEELALKSNIASPTFTGKVTTAATSTGGAGFNLPHGTAPSSPANGDFWSTTAGVYARVNGSTVGPFGAGGGTPDDTPDNGDTTNPPTANWAYDHAASTATHGISGALVGTSDSATLTNKTLDVEGTGNSITIVDKVWFASAGCNNTTAASFFDLPTANAPAAACITGTNTQKGVLDFDAATDESGQVSLALPSDFTGAIDVKYKWLAAATSGSVVWGVQTSCVADAETDDPSWNTASTVTDAAKGTTLQTNDASITGVTATGCSAGELLHLRFFRDADNGSDNMTGDARLIGAEVTIRRAQ